MAGRCRRWAPRPPAAAHSRPRRPLSPQIFINWFSMKLFKHNS